MGNGEGECSVSSQATISSWKSPAVQSAAAARYQHEKGGGGGRVTQSGGRYSLTAYSSASFYQTPRQFFCISLQCGG